jgi:hypothetical protein
MLGSTESAFVRWINPSFSSADYRTGD